MINRKNLIIVGIVILLIIFGYALYLFFGEDKAPASRPGGVLPIPPPADVSIPTGETILIPAARGEAVETENFYKDSLVIDREGNVLIKNTSIYSLNFRASDSYFQLTIGPGDLTKIAKNAEKDFLNTLGISKEDACRLSAMIFIPVSVDVERAGHYTLSFCPGGNPLR